MSWFSGKVSLGGFPDLSGGFPDISGAVTKFSESVKNIEKNFDSALGLEEKVESSSGDGSSSGEASGMWRSSTDRKALFEPMMSFMGQKGEDTTAEDSEKAESSGRSSFEEQKDVSTDKPAIPSSEQTSPAEKDNEAPENKNEQEHLHIEAPSNEVSDPGEAEIDSQPVEVKTNDATVENVETNDTTVENVETNDTTVENVETNDVTVENVEQDDESLNSLHQEGNMEMGIDEGSQSVESMPRASVVEQVESIVPLVPDESYAVANLPEEKRDAEDTAERGSDLQVEVVEHEQPGNETDTSGSTSAAIVEAENASEVTNEHLGNVLHSDLAQDSADISIPQELTDKVSNLIKPSQQANDFETDTKEQSLSSATNISNSEHSALDIETVKMEMKMMEAALQGAARQSQAKADEIAKLMIENEHLKIDIEDLKRKSNEEIESLRVEYHQRVSTLERKVYTLSKERDTLRREQNRKSDAAALLKEKDEIITQVMAEGEELSKKQATQESLIRKLRAQIREFEEEKKGLITKLQVEENKMESIKKDKAVTEKYLEETIEKHQAELAAQKEQYTNALNAAKEAEALAEARANKEARTELESRLREAEERESTLVQALEELRQTLSRKEQQTAFREDMLRKDIDDLQKRYQESERRCEELVTQVPESTRPLLRQIEAIQEATARKAEAWAGVERSLNTRLQEAEAKAAGAEENERTMNERLSQTISRMAVLEAQVSCLRAEQTQLSRSLDKERQRASENRQEYLAAQEAVATYEGRVNQLEEEIKMLKKKHKHELQEIVVNRELLQQELEREKAARLDFQRTARVETSPLGDQAASTKHTDPYLDNGSSSARKLSSAESLGSMEESFFLQASLDSSDSFSDRRHSEATMTPYHLKSITPNAFEATLRQKDGELASYMSRLASLESIRDSLAEELVKMTAQCEKLRTEAAVVPGVRAELDALRRRHSAALELMGERDEELEELRADIMDLKEMYREQVNLLVNKIQVMSSSIGAS